MTSLSDKIAAAKSAPREFLDITVSLNKDLSESLEALTSELAEAKKAKDDRHGAPTAASTVQAKIDAVMAEAVDTLVTMRFTLLPGDKWRELTQQCPPNPELILDRHLGYSVAETCKLAAKYVDRDGRVYGHVVNGDDLEVPTVHKVTKSNPTPTDEWQDMFSLMSGPEFTAIVDTVYALNVDAPVKRLAELKSLGESDRLRQTAKIAVERGISPRRLNGWEPAEVTEYEHVDGVLVRSVTRREPEFNDDDIDLMLASVAFEAGIGRNGHLLSRTMSSEADPTNYNSTLRYTAHGPFWDWDEKARLDDIDRYRNEFPKDSPPNLNGAYWVTEEIGELSGDLHD